MKKYLSLFIFFVSISVKADYDQAREWIEKTLPEELRSSHIPPSEKINYLKDQNMPSGVTIQDVISTVLDME